MTDQELLGSFVSEQSEAAFRDLVARHGPGVLRACRRHLHAPEAIEDAFQATFLVLVRKAPSIQDPKTLGNWLFGVALRVAARARRDACRRRDHERRSAEMAPSHDEPGRHWDDSDRVVREELARLPQSFRQPIELCYLEGRSHEEAARELNWPLGTLKTRLVRGRRQLRGRLARRGLAPALLLLLWPRSRADAAVPEALLRRTVDAMLADARGGPAVGTAFARPDAMARAYEWAPRPLRWLGPLLVLLAIASAATIGLSIRGQARADEFERFAMLPANLTDVLNVECR
jgi:RNA polymerase sigma factor (sigma-70 family)